MPNTNTSELGLDEKLVKMNRRINRGLRELSRYTTQHIGDRDYNPQSPYCQNNGEKIDLTNFQHVLFWALGSSHKYTLSNTAMKSLGQSYDAFMQQYQFWDTAAAGLSDEISNCASSSDEAKLEILERCQVVKPNWQALKQAHASLIKAMSVELKSQPRHYAIPMELQPKHISQLQAESPAWNEYVTALSAAMASSIDQKLKMALFVCYIVARNQSGLINETAKRTFSDFINTVRKRSEEMPAPVVEFADRVIKEYQQGGNDLQWVQDFLNCAFVPAIKSDYRNQRYHEFAAVMKHDSVEQQVAAFIEHVLQRPQLRWYANVAQVVERLGGTSVFTMNLLGDKRDLSKKFGVFKNSRAKQLLRNVSAAFQVSDDGFDDEVKSDVSVKCHR